jgi:hypothetical protein
VHHHFFPHYIDWPVLFPSYCDPSKVPPFPVEHLDLRPAERAVERAEPADVPADAHGHSRCRKQEIRRWMNWARENVQYLLVRHDLPDWPADGVDGSAHVIGDRGLIFLFNPDAQSHDAEFDLTKDGIGLDQSIAAEDFVISQEHPSHVTAHADSTRSRHGEKVRWVVPGHTAVVLRLRPGR